MNKVFGTAILKITPLCNSRRNFCHSSAGWNPCLKRDIRYMDESVRWHDNNNYGVHTWFRY